MAHTDDIEIDQQELLDILNSAFLKATINDCENAQTTTERISQSLKQLRCYDSFREFVERQSAKSSTWKFWAQFIFEDAFAYIGLFLSIRSGSWELRNGSIKMMASLFSAYDHLTYKKLIANHLADILTLPANILTSLQNGSFVVSCTGRSWHSVGIDECHEMCINKDCKCCIVRPSKDFINRIANYIPYRVKSLKNLLKQLSLKPASEKQVETPKDNLSSKPSVLKISKNISEQRKAINLSGLLDLTEDKGLRNPLCKKVPTPDQERDLSNFRAIGQISSLSITFSGKLA